jgi:two-component system response regulator WspF
MDLIMPKVDGIEATRRIMAEDPCPILVVTATVSGHMNKVYEAMGLGALDAVDTPRLGPKGEPEGAGPLLEKIELIGWLVGKPPDAEVPSFLEAPPKPVRIGPVPPLVLLGASTGGPAALAETLSGLPRSWDTTTIIVQHVDADFAPGLATWLAERAGRRIEIVTPGRAPHAGDVLLAATNDHLYMDPDRRLRYVAEPADFCYRPSVDVLFASVAAHWPEPGVAALLTGMQRDGAEGLLKLRRAGWRTIAQDEATSVIWGMPRAAVEVGAAGRVLPVSQIAGAIVELIRRPSAAP